MYINRFLFETVHQEYNPSLVKISNLLYLLTDCQPSSSGPAIAITQDEIAGLLGLSLAQLTRGLTALREQCVISTGRGKIHVVYPPALARLCTSEIF